MRKKKSQLILYFFVFWRFLTAMSCAFSFNLSLKSVRIRGSREKKKSEKPRVLCWMGKVLNRAPAPSKSSAAEARAIKTASRASLGIRFSSWSQSPGQLDLRAMKRYEAASTEKACSVRFISRDQHRTRPGV